MPSRGRKKTIRSKYRYTPAPAREVSWIESDSYDRRAWQQLRDSTDSIRDLEVAGQRLVPLFSALLYDLFLGLFKLNLTWRNPEKVRASAALNREILAQIFASDSFRLLRQRTVLEEDKAALAAVVLAEQAVAIVRRETLLNREELLDLWNLNREEERFENLNEALRRLADQSPPASPEGPTSEEAQPEELPKPEELEKVRAALERAARVSEARLRQKTRQTTEMLRNARKGELRRLEMESFQLAGEIDRVADDSQLFGMEFGQAGGHVSASERLELSRRLARNKRLGELARLVGRLKLEARRLERRSVSRGAAEAHDVERGDELGRLLPAELATLSIPGLARDFRRRLIERAVLQYELQDRDNRGKGPMIVCLDVSSSMAGEKELWAKAVTLTLMDIARRRRRLFRAILFSSGPDTLRVFELNHRQRYQPDLKQVLDLAEYYPGGGTDFETPLSTAARLLEDRELRRGDIVFITDGEAEVHHDWLKAFEERKRELEFSILAVLIDVGTSRFEPLARLCDRITSVSRLSDRAAGDIFINVMARAWK